MLVGHYEMIVPLRAAGVIEAHRAVNGPGGRRRAGAKRAAGRKKSGAKKGRTGRGS